MHMQLSRYPSRRCLLRQSSTTSTSSSFSVDQGIGKPALVSSPSFRSTAEAAHSSCCLPRRRVCFAQDDNEVYFNPDDLEPHEIAAAWYSDAEIETMRAATQQLADQLLQASSSDNARKRKIQRAYTSFCAVSPSSSSSSSIVSDVDLIVTACQYMTADLPTGLEKYLLLPRERELRAARLRRDVHYWTVTSIDCRESDRANQLRLASERASRPARLFAFFVAMSTTLCCQ